MKKTARILSLILLLVMLSAQLSFASGLEVVNISPKDGEKGKQVSNMAIKVTFSENMIDPAAIADNESKFKITDPEGNEQPFQIVFSEEKYPDQLWLILEGELAQDTEYTFEIMPGIKAKSGNVLESGSKTTFRTRNTGRDSKISMLLMLAMMFVMFYASSRAAKKSAEEENGVESKQYNPYKMAKEKGISVNEAKAIIAKDKEKEAKKAAKLAEQKRAKEEAMAAEVAAAQKRLEEEYEAARHANNYQVKGPRSIKAAGFKVPRSVVKKNKAKREAAKAAEKARAKKK